MNKKHIVWIGLLASVFIAFALSPFASSLPDGLNRVATDHGFAAHQQAAAWKTPLSGYRISGLGDRPLATGLAGFAGAVLTFLFSLGLGKWLLKRKNNR